MEYDKQSVRSATVHLSDARNNDIISYTSAHDTKTTNANNGDFLSTNAHIGMPNKEITVD